MTDLRVSRLTAKAVVKVVPELRVSRLTAKAVVKVVPELQVSRLVLKVLMVTPTAASPTRVQMTINT